MLLIQTFGNLTATIFDQLLQFAIILNMFGNIPGNKSNIYERDWSKFDQENFILDYFSVNWRICLKLMNLMLIIQPKYI